MINTSEVRSPSTRSSTKFSFQMRFLPKEGISKRVQCLPLQKMGSFQESSSLVKQESNRKIGYIPLQE